MPDQPFATAARPVTSSPAGHVHYEDDPETCTEFCDPTTVAVYEATGWGACDGCSTPRPIRYSPDHGAWFCRNCWHREVTDGT